MNSSFHQQLRFAIHILKALLHVSWEINLEILFGNQNRSAIILKSSQFVEVGGIDLTCSATEANKTSVKIFIFLEKVGAKQRRKSISKSSMHFRISEYALKIFVPTH